MGADLHDDSLPLLLVRYVDDFLHHIVSVRVAYHNLQERRSGKKKREENGTGRGGGGEGGEGRQQD